MKGIVISGMGSGAGKTSVTSGLLSKMSVKYEIQAFKVGPDFIDPMFHTIATGRQSRNLDTFMMSKDKIRNYVGTTSKGADLCVVEGVRGLFEGLSGTTDECSTAEMAKLLGFPVILVVDSRSLTRSAAAMINGFKDFDKDLNIAGVILNNISGKQHEEKILDAMERYSDIEVLGTIRRDKNMSTEQRYLGLKTPRSRKEIISMESLVQNIDEERILDATEDVEFNTQSVFTERPRQGIKAAIPRDDAFCFYYQDNIDCMRASGIDIEFFSPVKGEFVDADMYYLGGGYPELHAADIENNTDFREGLRNASDEGKVVIGECGGLMAMCENICGSDGKHKAAGIFKADAKISGRHGPTYTITNSTEHNKFFKGVVKGHEFHYSEIELHGKYEFGFEMTRGQGITGTHDGLVHKNSIGSYMHQHALSKDDWFGDILKSIERQTK